MWRPRKCVARKFARFFCELYSTFFNVFWLSECLARKFFVAPSFARKFCPIFCLSVYSTNFNGFCVKSVLLGVLCPKIGFWTKKNVFDDVAPHCSPRGASGTTGAFPARIGGRAWPSACPKVVPGGQTPPKKQPRGSFWATLGAGGRPIAQRFQKLIS